MKDKLHKYLYKLLELNGSDLHLKAGSFVHMRINGELHTLKNENLNNENVLAIADKILTTLEYNALIVWKVISVFE